MTVHVSKIAADVERLNAKRKANANLDKLLNDMEKIENELSSSEGVTDNEKPVRRPYSSDPVSVSERWN
jgi:hypothetical protein